MLGAEGFPAKEKSQKRQNVKDSNAGNNKRTKQAQNDECYGAEGSAPNRVDHQQGTSPIDQPIIRSISTETPSTSGGFLIDSARSLYAPDRLAEVVLEFNINLNDKNKEIKNDNINKVLKAEIALRNTSGGIIKINCPQAATVKSRDDWMKVLYEQRKKSLGSESGEKDSFDDILDIDCKDLTTYIFVRKSSVTIETDDSYLLQRSEERNYKVQLYTRICNVVNREKKQCICATEAKWITSFHLGDTMSYETITEEHKQLKCDIEKTAKQLCEHLSDNIVSFANTQGGTVYFGIRDTDARIIGVNIKDDEMKTAIHRCIVQCMIRKHWVLESGERDDPVEDKHYHIRFFPVIGAVRNMFVIAVHICLFPGTAVFRKEPECSVLNQDNQVVNMDFKKWLALHKCSKENENDEKKLKKRKHGRMVYYSVKETIPDLVRELKTESFLNLNKHPINAVEVIDNELLSKFMEATKLMLKTKKWQGISYIERTWKLNLGLPGTKPDGVICDVLLCSQHFPLILVTLSNSEETSESTEYNIQLATTLKRILVQEGGCLEKMYIKPVTLSSLEEVDRFSKSSLVTASYPKAYNAITEEKYTNILQALVLILTRANSMATHTLGKQFFNLLTKAQYEILFENFESPKLMVTGPPGCGKTVLAIERIHRLRQAGCKFDEVLFVCTNKPLKAKIKNVPKMQHDNYPLCLVMNYYEIMSRIKPGYKLKKVKHIVADEVQNYKFRPNDTSFNWWKMFVRMCKNGTSLWVFSDLSQQIITEPSVHEQLHNKFPCRKLNTVIRMTGEIYKFLYSRLSLKCGYEVQLGHDFDGEKVKVLIPKRPSNVDPCTSRSLYTDTLILVLHKLIVCEGYNKNRITVLFTDTKQRSKYEPEFNECTINCAVIHGEDVTKRGVVFDTIRRYSGSEKDIVIVFCPEFYSSGSQENNGLMVTAGSRAMMKLILILQNEYEAKSFGLEDLTENIEVPCNPVDSFTDFATDV